MLKKRKNQYYGDNHADIRECLSKYSKDNGYAIDHYADVSCTCAGTVFWLILDDTEGAALRKCVSCQLEHPIRLQSAVGSSVKSSKENHEQR